MKNSFGILGVSAAFLMSACGQQPGVSGVTDGSGDTPAAISADFTPGTRVHLMPMLSPGNNGGVQPGPKVDATQPGGPTLTYYGGPVISNVKIWVVYWNSKVNSQVKTGVAGFYKAITDSTYFDWLTEYNTPTQTIGRGSYGGSYTDTGAPTSKSITDADVQKEIARLISAGKLPPEDGNNLYMVYFPSDVTISLGGDQSCVTFCAYHGTFQQGGQDVFYGVLPDLGGACAGGCGGGTYFENTTSVSSHEMIEAVTDPAVGLATTYGAPLAWYDQTNGEIGDICNAEQGQVGDYTVQLQWSNSQGACVASAPAK